MNICVFDMFPSPSHFFFQGRIKGSEKQLVTCEARKIQMQAYRVILFQSLGLGERVVEE